MSAGSGGAELGAPDAWLLDHTCPGAVQLVMEQDGKPSRWNTLRARRVLDWYDAR